MKLVIVESPYAGDVTLNLAYVRAAMRDCLLRGESPFASHALYTQPGVLDDDVPSDRILGIEAGFAWGVPADEVLFYLDRGWNRGMRAGLVRARSRCARVRGRYLGAPWSDHEPCEVHVSAPEDPPTP